MHIKPAMTCDKLEQEQDAKNNAELTDDFEDY
jgi:hypothetical protein